MKNEKLYTTYKQNIKYLCQIHNLTEKDLRMTLKIRSYIMVESLIKLCNFFDQNADLLIYSKLS